MGNNVIKLNNRWKLYKNKELGGGSFAKVFYGEEIKTKTKVAIKRISNARIKEVGPRLETAIVREIKVLKACSKIGNPFLLKILDFFTFEEDSFLILEYCDSGDLLQVLRERKTIPEGEALTIAYQIVIGLKALSDLKIVHRDLKPANIFINGENYKIGDFGFANVANQFDTTLGTITYMAPELFTQDGNFTNAVDVWAFGCIVHQMIFGSYSFKGSNKSLVKKIVHSEYSVPATPNVSDETADMLMRCLIKKPKDRITVEQLVNHKCFNFCREEVTSRMGSKVKKSVLAKFSKYHEVRVQEDLNLVSDMYKGNMKIEANEPAQMQSNLSIEDIASNFNIIEDFGENKSQKTNFELCKRDLTVYRDVYLFYYESAKKLRMKISSTDRASLNLVKRGYERAKNLKTFLEKTDITDDCLIPISFKRSFWPVYRYTDDYDAFIAQVDCDIEEIRLKMKQMLDEINFEGEKVSKSVYLLKDSKSIYGEVLKDSSFNIRRIVSNFKAQRGGENSDLETAIRLLLIHSIENFGRYVPFYSDVQRFNREMMETNEDVLVTILDNYCQGVGANLGEVVK